MAAKQYSTFAILRRASDGRLLTGLSGDQYSCTPKHMLFGGMAEGSETVREALIRELPEELGFDEDHYAFLHAVYEDDFSGAVSASGRIMERIREENAFRLANAGSASVARAIEEETAAKQRFFRQALVRVADLPKDQIKAAMEAQDQANQVIAHIEGHLDQLDHFFEHLEEVSDDEKREKAWIDVHSFYFNFDLSDRDYACFKDLLATKIRMGLDYEVSAYSEMSETQMRALAEDKPEKFLYEPQRLAIREAVSDSDHGQRPNVQQRLRAFAQFKFA